MTFTKSQCCHKCENTCERWVPHSKASLVLIVFLWFSLYFLCCDVFTLVTVVRLFLSFYFFAMVLSVNLRLMNLNMLNIDLLGILRLALIANSLLSFKLVVILLCHHRYFVHSKIIKEIMQLETDSQQLPMMAYLHSKHTLNNT